MLTPAAFMILQLMTSHKSPPKFTQGSPGTGGENVAGESLQCKNNFTVSRGAGSSSQALRASEPRLGTLEPGSQLGLGMGHVCPGGSRNAWCSQTWIWGGFAGNWAGQDFSVWCHTRGYVPICATWHRWLCPNHPGTLNCWDLTQPQPVLWYQH